MRVDNDLWPSCTSSNLSASASRVTFTLPIISLLLPLCGQLPSGKPGKVRILARLLDHPKECLRSRTAGPAFTPTIRSTIGLRAFTPVNHWSDVYLRLDFVELQD